MMLIAGSESIVSSMCAFLINLHQHPRVHSKLLGGGGLGTENLEAVITETLRFSHPAPNFFPRIVATPVMLPSGHTIPKGTEVSMNPHCVMRDRDVFGMDADTFRPERWLEDRKSVGRMEMLNNIWVYGPAMCLGKSVAKLKITIVLREIRSPCPNIIYGLLTATSS